MHWNFLWGKNVRTAVLLSSMFKNLSIGEINKYNNIRVYIFNIENNYLNFWNNWKSREMLIIFVFHLYSTYYTVRIFICQQKYNISEIYWMIIIVFFNNVTWRTISFEIAVNAIFYRKKTKNIRKWRKINLKSNIQ